MIGYSIPANYYIYWSDPQKTKSYFFFLSLSLSRWDETKDLIFCGIIVRVSLGWASRMLDANKWIFVLHLWAINPLLILVIELMELSLTPNWFCFLSVILFPAPFYISNWAWESNELKDSCLVQEGTMEVLKWMER